MTTNPPTGGSKRQRNESDPKHSDSKDRSRTLVTTEFASFLLSQVQKQAGLSEKKAVENLAKSIGINGKRLRQLLAGGGKAEMNPPTVDLMRQKFGPAKVNILLNLPFDPGNVSDLEDAAIRSERIRKFCMFSCVIDDETVHKTLHSLYMDQTRRSSLKHVKPEFLHFGGRATPLLVFWAEEGGEHVETPLGELIDSQAPLPTHFSEEFDPDFNAAFFDEVDKSIARNGFLWSDATYTMRKLVETAQGVKLQCGLGRYLLATNTCDSLEDELLAKQLEKFGLELGPNDLPRRQWLHNKISPEIAYEVGAHRSAAIAISTLTIFAHPTANQFNTFIQHRSFKVRKHGGLAHVIPSGMSGPVVRSVEPGLEYSVRHNVIREFYEELFNEHEAMNAEDQSDPLWFMLREPVKQLVGMLESTDPAKKAELLYTGMAINLMNLRPEICTLLIVRDPTWFTRASAGDFGGEKLKLSELEFEWKNVPYELLNEFPLREYHGRVPLTDRLELKIPTPLLPRHLVPPAAAAIDLGLRAARIRLGIAQA